MGIESSRGTMQPSSQEKQMAVGLVRDETQRLCWHHHSLSSGQISAV